MCGLEREAPMPTLRDRQMIIDAHAHCDIRFGWRHTPDVLLAMMAEAGVDKPCITTYADLPGEARDLR